MSEKNVKKTRKKGTFCWRETADLSRPEIQQDSI